MIRVTDLKLSLGRSACEPRNLYSLPDVIGMGGVCSTHGRDEECIRNFVVGT